eukprot:TRINITY_DN4921_c0_g2_i1.p1 TRINITY_DN4921_c0_g2~~TRINITY_DN4921_c0_g2_i1.p1  ORF type:complete len:755 (-),score=90.41 TRINITY_DN4921_c0_g2_i1:29-2293(-)
MKHSSQDKGKERQITLEQEADHKDLSESPPKSSKELKPKKHKNEHHHQKEKMKKKQIPGINYRQEQQEEDQEEEKDQEEEVEDQEDQEDQEEERKAAIEIALHQQYFSNYETGGIRRSVNGAMLGSSVVITALAQRMAYLAKHELLPRTVADEKEKTVQVPREASATSHPIEYPDESDADDEAWERPELRRVLSGRWVNTKVPPLNILMLIIGSRGDVQPFLALAIRLNKEGHTVRLATHNDFKDFVEKNGVEFFPIGGDPKELMSFMVRHPDMITFDQKEIKANRKQMLQVFETSWIAAGHGDPSTYYPDVIIANPPTQIHVHIANALQIPLHIMFTMPWSPTKDYVHPLATLGAGVLYGNKGSYRVVDELLWVGMKKEINSTRKLMGLSTCHRAGSFAATMKVPHTYCMSPNLALRPRDWGPHIDVVGFWFLEGSGHGHYDPPEDLKEFLEAGDPPVYIGFGSVTVQDPLALTNTIFGAVKKAKVRAIISEGWGGLGGGIDIPKNVYMIGAAPHTWLFAQCSAVCHHGGAGTTATGLIAGKPTIIVPFFGDQPFWGKCVSRAECGPEPIPIRELSIDNLATAFEFCKNEHVKRHAVRMGEKISAEDGLGEGVAAFHKKLPINENGEWVVDIYENQRYSIAGWKAVIHKLRNRHPWSDRSGYSPLWKDKFYLPKGWSWVSDWEVDINEHTDKDGWRYAVESKHSALHKTHNPIDTFRMRRWVRRRVHTKHFLSYTHRIQDKSPIMSRPSQTED